MQTISLDEETVCAPKIVKKLPEVVESEESRVTKLEVKVIGKPKPETRWLHDDVEIQPNEVYEMQDYHDGTSVLLIKGPRVEDTGKITFEAHNPYGVAETTTELAVQGIFDVYFDVVFSLPTKRKIQFIFPRV